MSRIGLAMAGKKSPWGASIGANGGGESGSGEDSAEDDSGVVGENPPPRGTGGPRNPWLPPASGDARRPPNLEDLFRRRSGGGGRRPIVPHAPAPGGKSWLPLGIGAIVLIWLGSSMVHRIAPQEKGVVTTFGAYSRTISSGVSFTLPWPIQTVTVKDVTSIRRDSIPDGEGEKLMLTGDQNLVDLTYLVRWNIKDIKLYMFQLAEPTRPCAKWPRPRCASPWARFH